MKRNISILDTGYADITELKEWADNPRIIYENEIDAVVEQITELGLYKPILVTPDGTVIGGNARLKALHRMGETRVWVSVIDAKTHSERLFVALADNDTVGSTDTDKLMSLIGHMLPETFRNYTVDFGQSKSVEDLLAEGGIGNEAPSDQASNIQKMILPFSNDDYERVLAALDKIMAENNLDDHTAAVIHLLENYD